VAKTYAPIEGTEIFPPVRLITLGARDSHIKGFKAIALEDVVYQPRRLARCRHAQRRVTASPAWVLANCR